MGSDFSFLSEIQHALRNAFSILYPSIQMSPKNGNQSHARRVGRGLAPAEKSHRFRGGLGASRPTFVLLRKPRILFSILRHGFAVPPPLPKEANFTVSFLVCIILRNAEDGVPYRSDIFTIKFVMRINDENISVQSMAGACSRRKNRIVSAAACVHV